MLDLFETQPRTHSCVRFMERLRYSLLLLPFLSLIIFLPSVLFPLFFVLFCEWRQISSSALLSRSLLQRSAGSFTDLGRWLIHPVRPFWTQEHCCLLLLFFVFCVSSRLSLSLSKLGSVKFVCVVIMRRELFSGFHPCFHIFHFCVWQIWMLWFCLLKRKGKKKIKSQSIEAFRSMSMIYNVRSFIGLYICFSVNILFKCSRHSPLRKHTTKWSKTTELFSKTGIQPG